MSAKPVGSAVGKPEPVGDAGFVIPVKGFENGRVNLAGRITLQPGDVVTAVLPTKHHLRSAGLRSSEFWLCSFCACVGSALALWAASPLDLTGAMLLGLATASYAWSRGKAKGRSVVQGKL